MRALRSVLAASLTGTGGLRIDMERRFICMQRCVGRQEAHRSTKPRSSRKACVWGLNGLPIALIASPADASQEASHGAHKA
jgi:hypothetical protein